jgi:methionyl-tRNA formyltransferase
MRILFMGTPEFALPSLGILLENQYPVVAVATTPDRPKGRGQKTAGSPVKEFALQHHLPLLQPESLNDPGFVSSVSELQPDLIVVVAFRILPKEIYTIPRLGSFNLHASLLPKFRGAAPINWAIIRGEKGTGVTTFFLKDKVDTGSLLLQARVAIGPDETAGELYDKLAEVGAEIVLQTVRLIERGKARPLPQDDAQATTAPKIFKDDCRLSWSGSARTVHNMVRGLSPHPCAWTMHQERVLRIYRTAMQSEQKGSAQNAPSGTVMTVEKENLVVATAEGMLSILDIQQEGKKRMGIAEFLRGYPMQAGDVLH